MVEKNVVEDIAPQTSDKNLGFAEISDILSFETSTRNNRESLESELSSGKNELLEKWLEDRKRWDSIQQTYEHKLREMSTRMLRRESFLESKIDALMKQDLDSSVERNRLQETVAELKLQIREVTRERNALQDARELLKTADSPSLNQSRTQELQEMEKQVQSYQEELQAAYDHVEEFREENHRLKMMQEQDQDAQSEASVQRLQEANKQLESENKRMHGQVIGLRSSLDESLREVSRLKEECLSLRSVSSTQDVGAEEYTRITNLVEDVASLKRQLERVEMENESLKQTEASTQVMSERLLRRLEQQIQTSENLKSQLTGREQFYEEELSRLEEINKKLQSHLNQMRDERELPPMTMEDVNPDPHHDKETIQDLTDENRALERTVQALREEILHHGKYLEANGVRMQNRKSVQDEVEMERYKSEVTHQKTIIAESRKEIADLEQDCATLRQSNIELQTEMTSHKNENFNLRERLTAEQHCRMECEQFLDTWKSSHMNIQENYSSLQTQLRGIIQDYLHGSLQKSSDYIVEELQACLKEEQTHPRYSPAPSPSQNRRSNPRNTRISPRQVVHSARSTPSQNTASGSTSISPRSGYRNHADRKRHDIPLLPITQSANSTPPLSSRVIHHSSRSQPVYVSQSHRSPYFSRRHSPYKHVPSHVKRQFHHVDQRSPFSQKERSSHPSSREATVPQVPSVQFTQGTTNPEPQETPRQKRKPTQGRVTRVYSSVVKSRRPGARAQNISVKSQRTPARVRSMSTRSTMKKKRRRENTKKSKSAQKANRRRNYDKPWIPGGTTRSYHKKKKSTKSTR